MPSLPGSTTLLFQSSPSPKAGSYFRMPGYPPPTRRFNPLPARRPGATNDICIEIPVLARFNPLPARRPGATKGRVRLLRGTAVSILSQPEGRELLLDARGKSLDIHVSILSQPEGRELQAAHHHNKHEP